MWFRLRLHGFGRIRNRSTICTSLPGYTEPVTVRSLFFKCLHGTGQIKISSLSQCIMVVVLFRTVENTPVDKSSKAFARFLLFSRWIEEKITIWRIVNCMKPINGASKASSANPTSSLLISSLYLANIFALYISCQLSLVFRLFYYLRGVNTSC